VKPTETISAFIMAGYKSTEDFAITDPVTGITTVFDGPNFYGNWGGE
jgi:hypothetical protein